MKESFGYVSHYQNLIVLVMWIFAVSRSGDACSLDAWIRARVFRKPSLEESGDYHWPLRLILVLWSLVFFAAAIAKLRHSGLAWVFSDSVSNYIFDNQKFYHNYSSFRDLYGLSTFVAQRPSLCSALAGITLGLEFAAPLVLPDFSSYLAVYATFISWDRLDCLSWRREFGRSIALRL